MNSFLFSTCEELESAVCSGMIPQDVLRSPAVLQCRPDGSLLVCSRQKIKKTERERLQGLGLLLPRNHRQAKDGDRQEDDIAVRHWAEIVPPQPQHVEPAGFSLVLFRLSDGQQLQAVSRELLRLGCDRQSFFRLQAADGRHVILLRVASPPYFTLLQALDASLDVKLYVPVYPGQESLWIEPGFRHTALATIDCVTDGLVLINGDGEWEYFPGADWVRLYESLEIHLDTASAQTLEATVPPRIEVPLRLVEKGREATASLWLIRENALQTVENLVARMPAQELSGISFVAATQQERTIVILKRRAHWHKELFLELPADSCVSCAAWGGLESLYLPVDAILEPPLRADKLAELLVPDPEQLTIVTAGVDGAVDTYRAAHQDFQLLEHWVDYVIAQNLPQLEPWIKACSFDFGVFESVGVEWSELMARQAGGRADQRAARAGSQARKRAQLERQPERQRQPARGNRPGRSSEEASGTGYDWSRLFSAPVRKTEEEQRLLELENEFIALDAPAGDAVRVSLWEALAACNTRLQRPREAAQCWVRLAWLQPDDGDTVKQWLAAERSLFSSEDETPETIRGLLKQSHPSADQVRLFALELIAAGGVYTDPAAVRQWLLRHETVLDVRTLWLVWLSLSQASGDLLQLVDARDRILARLRNGLSLEKDIPGFMRFCGSRHGDSLAVSGLQQELSKLLLFYNGTKRRRETLEASPAMTNAYVYYVFAWGFARLNQPEKTDELIAQARQALDRGDPVHALLSGLYEARIQQAREGVPREAPLDREIYALLDRLERLPRFKVDRVMQGSQLLAPQLRLMPFKAFCASAGNASGNRRADLRGLTGSSLLREIDALLQRALQPGSDADSRLELFELVMDVLLQAGEAEAFSRLEMIIDSLPQMPPLSRCTLLEDALLLAGFYSRTDIINRLLVEIDSLVADVDGQDLGSIAGMLSQFVSSLRRVGMSAQGLHILEKTYERFHGTGGDDLVARIHVASGFAELGRQNVLEQVFEEAGRYLAGEEMILSERLEITAALAQAAGCMHHDSAVVRIHDLAKQLASISDNLSTNSHLCLSVVSFVESLVLGICSDRLVLGDLGGRWLGEDEFLVRDRIQRDLQAMQR